MAKAVGTVKIDGREKDVFVGGKTGRKLTIWTRSVGQSFATVGVVKCGSEDVSTTREFPHGFTGPAYEAAEALIDSL